MPYINSSRVTHYQAKAVIWVVIHLTFLKAEESGVRSQELGVRSQESESPCPPCPPCALLSLC